MTHLRHKPSGASGRNSARCSKVTRTPDVISLHRKDQNSCDPTVGRDRKINMPRYGEETMDDPISPARRTLLKAGAATLATPVAAAIAQPAAAVGHQEAKSFDLWVISDQHVGTDKAASEGIQHGLV